MKTFFKIFFGALLACIVASFLGFFILMGIVGTAFSTSSAEVVKMKPNSVLKIDFSTPIVEYADAEAFTMPSLSNMSLGFNLNSESITTYDAVRAIEKAATDPLIKYIYINTDKASLSISQCEDLRKALKKFRASGKAIVAYGSSFATGSYYIASVADKVIMDVNGSVQIFGISSNILFLKDLLDKVGLKMQLIRHGKYKSAAEQYIRNDISDENREQNQEMINSLWDALAQDIADSRGFTTEEFNSWIDELELYNNQKYMEHHIVDDILYMDELKSYLCNLSDVDKFKDINFVSLADYASVAVDNSSKEKNTIAILYAEGEIVLKGTKEGEIAANKYVREIEKLRTDSTVKAVVLRVSSPGGDAQAAEMIRRELELLRQTKPVIASYGDYAASGGYWISAQADKIFTDHTTLTGSVGVFSMVPSFEGVLKNLHVNSVTISSNKHSDMFSGMRDMEDSEIVMHQHMIEKIYNDFTSIVADGRNMS
ncbi:MAG: signal peptide peptidase SppA, partial [Bacteroidales bacterium]|nr:signal peptide peptidase SppA [Bacteroidales bacterium]